MALNQDKVSIIIPAFNEADRIGATLDAVVHHQLADEIIVVDDGSTDGTNAVALEHGASVIRRKRNRGKGAAMNTGLTAARGGVIVFVDADLGDTAAAIKPVIEAVTSGRADLAVATFSTRGGFGIVQGLARAGIRLLSGFVARSPLSGQRAMRREVLNAVYPLRRDFGVETAMLIDAARAGFRIVEIPVNMSHRQMGRTLTGFLHRGRQGAGILRAIIRAAVKYSTPAFLKRKKPAALGISGDDSFLPPPETPPD